MSVSLKVGEPSPSLTARVRKIDFPVTGACRKLNEAIEIRLERKTPRQFGGGSYPRIVLGAEYKASARCT
jgi:hypothetical protein